MGAMEDLGRGIVGGGFKPLLISAGLLPSPRARWHILFWILFSSESLMHNGRFRVPIAFREGFQFNCGPDFWLFEPTACLRRAALHDLKSLSKVQLHCQQAARAGRVMMGAGRLPCPPL